MANVIIKRMADGLMRNRPFGDSQKQKEFALTHLNTGFTSVAWFKVNGEGVEAAEEVFDLTNNPSRQQERVEVYGRGPSLSSGDIVEVDGVNYLCCSFGWEKL